MTDRVYMLSVTLDSDFRDDDIKCIIDAIMMIRGVLRVRPQITDDTQWAARERARYEIRDKIMKALNETT